MTDMIARIETAVATLKDVEDNLCHVLLMLAGSRCITVIPQPDTVTPKPVIMVPQRLYGRMLRLSEQSAAEKDGA